MTIEEDGDEQQHRTNMIPSEDRCSIRSTQRDFHAYQLSLFLVTQLGYFATAGSAVVGAFLSGFLADSCGRKPVVVGAMIIMCVGNALLAAFGNLTPYLATVIFFVIGGSCGGYMVTNLVLMIENLEHAKSRLLVVSLNGWPLGMAYVGFIAWITNEWRTYHIIFAATSAALFIILQFISLESVRWLTHQKRLRRADKIQLQIDARNMRVNELLPKIMQSQEFEVSEKSKSK
uniref:Major facilitator superfamily (MFS) profile domain-containing protein n=1 Tax=Panagrolaimus sp. ES5 TaxID=591445 RepID=A0AC34FLY7_9BILA